MEVSGLMSGGAPLVRRYQVGASITRLGQAHRVSTGNNAGIRLVTTTVALDFVGVNLDTATYTTTQGSGADSAERLISIVINPDAILRMKMSGGATEGTALEQHTVSTASSGGTAITTGTEWSSTTFDEGSTWGYSGANVGQLRKVTSVSSTAGTVTVPFDYGTVVGDVFLRSPYWPLSSTTIQLSTNVQEADATIAVGTGAQFRVIGLEANDIGNAGTTNSFVVAVPNAHFLMRGPSDT